MINNAQNFSNIVEKYLGRSAKLSDAIRESELVAVETRLRIKIPSSLRTYYLMFGNCDNLNSIYNQLVAPCDLTIESDYLIFMHENQEAVSWGLPIENKNQESAERELVVWQRNNTPPKEWFSEEQCFYEFMIELFSWYKAEHILPS